MPSYQNSYVSPTSQNINWQKGNPFPAAMSFELYIRESSNSGPTYNNQMYIESGPQGSPYSQQMYVEYNINYMGTSVNWLHISNFLSGPNNSFAYAGGGSQLIMLDLVNLESLFPGNYMAHINFTISDGYTVPEYVTYTVYLTVTSTGIGTDKSNYDLVFNRANNLLSGDTTVNILNNSGNEMLDFGINSTAFAPAEDFTNTFTLANSSTNPMQSNSEIPASGTKYYLGKLLDQNGVQKTTFGVTLVVVNEDGISVTPQSLDFEVFSSEISKNLKIVNPMEIAFTISEYPDWLQLSETSGTATKTITVSTVTENKDAGVYNGIIKVAFSGKSIDIPVSMSVKKFISYAKEDFNFCKNFQPMIFTKINEAARFVRAVVTAKYNIAGVETIVENEYINPYIADKASLNLGNKVHGHFPRLQDEMLSLSEGGELMKAASVDIRIEEIDSDYKILLMEVVQGLRFFPGRKPKAFPLLSNFLHRKKNKNSIFFFSTVENDKIMLEKVTDTNAVSSRSFGESEVKFYEFPRDYGMVHLQWENQNQVPEWFTFTGEYSISNEFTHTYSKDLFSGKNEKFDTTNVKQLKINTGFFMKEEIDLVEEIIKSKISFIKIGTKIYKVLNITQKYEAESSASEFFETDLELLIIES